MVLTAAGVPSPANDSTLRELADLEYVHPDGLAAALPGAQILFLWDFFSPAVRAAWPAADALEWIHIAAAGVDSLLFPQLQASPVVVTNARGVFDQPIAEFVAAAILAHDKALHQSKSLQRGQVWEHRESRRTAGSTALVVGTGGIGRACARLLRALGMQVRGAGRTARSGDPDFGTVVGTDDLAGAVAWADHVVLAAPLTQATRGLVGPTVLERMKPTAHLVNVGRGALVDEPALIASVAGGGIAAATLDVFDIEPLPAGHPFWAMPNVHVTPHQCGDVMGWREELAEQFEANLRDWIAGRELRNVVDKQSGYVPGSPPSGAVAGSHAGPEAPAE